MRALVREHEDGTIELALRQTTSDGSWSERILPDSRFLGAERVAGRWYTTSAVSIQDDSSGDTYCVISHGLDSDFFWSGVPRVAQRWADHRGHQVVYYGGLSPEGQARQIDQCVSDGAVGIVTTLPAPDALAAAISRAWSEGVVVTSFNSGANAFLSVGSIFHASVDEGLVGALAGERFETAGVSGKALCVIHEADNIGLTERCDGLESVLSDVERFSVPGTADLEATEQALADKLSDEDYGVVFTLNQQIAIVAVSAAPEGVVVGTVDGDPMVARAILDGQILFAIMTNAPFQIRPALDAAERIAQRCRTVCDIVTFEEILTFVSPARTVIDPIVLSADNAEAALRVSQRLRP